MKFIIIIIISILQVSLNYGQISFEKYLDLKTVEKKGNIMIDSTKDSFNLSENINNCVLTARLFFDSIKIEDEYTAIFGYTAIESIIYKQLPIAIGIQRKNQIIKERIICISDSTGFYSIKIPNKPEIVLFLYAHNYCGEVYTLQQIKKQLK